MDTRGNALNAVQPDEAIALHEQALEMFRDHGRQQEEGIALMNLGIALNNAGRPKEAVTCHRQARAIFQRIGPPYLLAATWNNLAMAWLDDRAFDHAVRAADQAAAGYLALGNTKGAVTALFNRFKALFGLGRHTDALETLQAALVRSAEDMVTPGEFGQLLNASALALHATEPPDDQVRAILEAAAKAYDEAGLPEFGDIARKYRERDARTRMPLAGWPGQPGAE